MDTQYEGEVQYDESGNPIDGEVGYGDGEEVQYDDQPTESINWGDIIPKGKMIIAIAALILFILLLRRALKASGNECGRGWYLVTLVPLFAMLWYSFILKAYTNYRRGQTPIEIDLGQIMQAIKGMRSQGAKINPAGIVKSLLGGFNVYMPNPWMVIVMFTLFLMFVQFTLSVILMAKHLPGRPFGQILSKAFMPSAFMMFVSGLMTLGMYFVITNIFPLIKFPPVIPVLGWAIEIVMMVDPSKLCMMFMPHTLLMSLAGYGIACEVVKKIPEAK